MSEIPLDLFQFEQIRYLPLPDILNLCKVNRTFYSICQNPETWRYLLFRDFHIQYDGPDVKEIYMEAYLRVQFKSVPVSKIQKIAQERNLDPNILIDVLEEDGFVLVGNEYRLLDFDIPSMISAMVDWSRGGLHENIRIGSGPIGLGSFETRNRYRDALSDLLPGFILYRDILWLTPYNTLLLYNYYHPGEDFIKILKQAIKDADILWELSMGGQYDRKPFAEELRQELLDFVDQIKPE